MNALYFGISTDAVVFLGSSSMVNLYPQKRHLPEVALSIESLKRYYFNDDGQNGK